MPRQTCTFNTPMGSRVQAARLSMRSSLVISMHLKLGRTTLENNQSLEGPRKWCRKSKIHFRGGEAFFIDATAAFPNLVQESTADCTRFAKPGRGASTIPQYCNCNLGCAAKYTITAPGQPCVSHQGRGPPDRATKPRVHYIRGY